MVSEIIPICVNQTSGTGWGRVIMGAQKVFGTRTRIANRAEIISIKLGQGYQSTCGQYISEERAEENSKLTEILTNRIVDF